MQTFSNDDWRSASELYAFLGNSLLDPMNRTEAVGLDVEFWIAISRMFNGSLEGEATALASWANGHAHESREHVVRDVSVEFTHLFVGPPKPAAAPWESAYGNVESHVGFGAATHEMRGIMRDMGLSLQNESNQYEDHIGIELLIASEMCRRIADGLSCGVACSVVEEIDAAPQRSDSNDGDVMDALRFAEYVNEHPLRWIGKMRARVSAEAPDGYFVRMLGLAEAALSWHVRQIEK